MHKRKAMVQMSDSLHCFFLDHNQNICFSHHWNKITDFKVTSEKGIVYIQLPCLSTRCFIGTWIRAEGPRKRVWQSDYFFSFAFIKYLVDHWNTLQNWMVIFILPFNQYSILIVFFFNCIALSLPFHSPSPPTQNVKHTNVTETQNIQFLFDF